MSDLAPFVAAALRDKVVAELQEENAGLLEEKERWKEIVLANRSDIEITGPGGFPTYASFPDHHLESLVYSSAHTCTLEMLMECEIHIFGSKVTSFKEIVERGECTISQQHCLNLSQPGVVDDIRVQIDSMLNDDYSTLVSDLACGKRSQAFEGNWSTSGSTTGDVYAYFEGMTLSKKLWRKIKRENKRKVEAAAV